MKDPCFTHILHDFRYRIVTRHRTSGFKAAILDTHTNEWAPVIDQYANDTVTRLNSGELNRTQIIGWRPDGQQLNNNLNVGRVDSHEPITGNEP